MRHRPMTVPLLMSAILASGLAGTTTAADPDVLDRSPTSWAGRTGASSPNLPDAPSLTNALAANGRIAFVRSGTYADDNAIWSMDAAGSALHQLAAWSSGFGRAYPAFSPGGTMIAFVGDAGVGSPALERGDRPFAAVQGSIPGVDGEGDIYVMRSDGTGIKRLTTSPGTYDRSPDWTPDGSRIVYHSAEYGNASDIFSMKLDGTDVRRLTSNPAADQDPSVSPDGKRIAFTSNRAGTDDFDIYTMDIDGSDVIHIDQPKGHDFEPDWSPDGTKIVFTSLRGLWPEIFVVNADGTGEFKLTTADDGADWEPSWSPDATKIAFMSQTDTVYGLDIWVIEVTGRAQVAIASSTAYDDWSPDWQPIPAFPLVDARFSTFKADIEWIFNEGITTGCSSERYCPGDAVTRGQMATFLVRALHLPPTAIDYFTDDNGTTHEPYINRVRAAGITVGCGPGLYCPTDKVTRGAMASFLARAFALAPTSADYFSDDDGTTHESNINKVAAAGITSGCTPTTYCPSADVTRGQMAAFLRRALE